jgi:hypothetical protein
MLLAKGGEHWRCHGERDVRHINISTMPVAGTSPILVPGGARAFPANDTIPVAALATVLTLLRHTIVAVEVVVVVVAAPRQGARMVIPPAASITAGKSRNT